MAQRVKNLPAVQETQAQLLGQKDPLEGSGYPLHSCLKNSMVEEPGGLQSMGSQKIRHN